MKHVCLNCGHTETRDFAPMTCPNCECDHVTDDSEMIDDDLTEAEVETLMCRVLDVAHAS